LRLARRTRGFEAPLTCSTGTFTPFNSASTLIALSAFEKRLPAQAASAAVLVFYRSGEAVGIATVNYASAEVRPLRALITPR